MLSNTPVLGRLVSEVLLLFKWVTNSADQITKGDEDPFGKYCQEDDCQNEDYELLGCESVSHNSRGLVGCFMK